MFRRILLIFLLILPGIFKANTGLARISDKDRFTNIRSGPGKEYPIAAIVNQDDFFYAEISDSAWVMVQTLQWERNGKQITGFIYKSKVQFISMLADSTKQALFQIVFQRQIAFVNAFTQTFINKDTSNYKKNRTELEAYSELHFDPLLGLFSEFFCKTQDSLILKLLIREIVINSGSADEYPGDILSECFICHPDFVLNQVKKIKNINDRDFLIEDIEYGMEGHYFIEENKPVTNKEFLRLKELLYTAK